MQILEIDTWVWLNDLTRQLGTPITLANVPAEAWDDVIPPGTDWVWLMGVWERSPLARELARTLPTFVDAQARALPDVTDADVVGSPYAVHAYVVDAQLGGTAGLATARAALRERGIRLFLDYVPNHVAPDHPWAISDPDRFVQGTAQELARDPHSFHLVEGMVLACGRDPYFPAWPDVVQLNAFAPAMRAATIDTLLTIAEQADGVRCDMAMLLLNDVFTRTWGDRVGAAPGPELWAEVIGAVKAQHPDFVFMAEAYWDREWDLQQLGFDLTYDKRLYDRLVGGDGQAVHDHLLADPGYQARSVRFIENHDEPRSAETFGAHEEMAAFVATTTLTGAAFVHEGQLDGRRVHLPVTLGRRPDEPLDRELRGRCSQVLQHLHDHRVRDGHWQLATVDGWPDNQSCRSLVAWTWQGDQHDHVVVINVGTSVADGQVHVALPVAGRQLDLIDVVSGSTFTRDGDQVARDGLYVRLEGHGAHLCCIPRS